MLVESEAQYMAVRGGMSDGERDVATPPAAPHLHQTLIHRVLCASVWRACSAGPSAMAVP